MNLGSSRGPRSSSTAVAAAMVLVVLAACHGGERPPPPAPPEDEPGTEGAPPRAPPGADPSDALPPAPPPPAAASCDALVPELGAPVEHGYWTGTMSECSVAITARDGRMALGVYGPSRGGRFHLFSPDGTATGSVEHLYGPLIPVAGGWHGTVHEPGFAEWFRAWDDGGELLVDRPDLVGGGIGPDGSGGSLFSASWAESPAPTGILAMSAAGDVVRVLPLDAGAWPILAMPGGAVFAVLSEADAAGARTFSARWYGPDGAPRTAPFPLDLAPDVRSFALAPLGDDRVAIRADGRWVRAVREEDARADAAPAWLAERPETAFVSIRGGRGHAIWSDAEPSADATAFEIVAADGTACGRVALPEAGAGTSPTDLGVGPDGTVLQRAYLPTTPQDFGVHCGWRVWPGALR